MNATQHLGNGVGVLISGASSNTVSGSNVVEFNTTGIQLTASAATNTVGGNTISNNTQDGVLIDSGSSSNTIGGTSSAAGNTISKTA